MLGAVAVPVAMASLPPLGFGVFAALVAVTALRKESRAVAGGLLVASGLWWLYFVRQAVERCDAFNRQPNGSCSIYGTEEQLAFAGSLIVVGVLLVAIALRNARARA